MRRLVAPVVVAGLAAALPGAAAAAPTILPAVGSTLTAKRGACATTHYTAPMSGYATVRGTARSGDWDLFVRDAGASRAFGANEVVQTWVTAGQRLAIKGCRRAGRARSFRIATTLADVKPPSFAGYPQMLDVRYSSQADLARLDAAGLDVTHDVTGGHAKVIAVGAKQLAAVRALGLSFDVTSKNLLADDAAYRRADAAAAQLGPSALPSGRTEYRTFADYQTELKDLVAKNPGLVKPVTLPEKTFQGRDIQGVEISRDVDANDDGKPVFVLVAAHHAREWPSAESAMEFAHLLVNGAGKDARIDALLDKERLVVIPTLNVDGFVESRGATDPADTIGEPLLQTPEGVAPPGGSLAYRRKNCDGAVPSGAMPCTLQWGIDPNRNYGQGWGGKGAGSDPWTQSYRGTGPWSEPETQAFHEYTQKRAVTGLITLHTVAALVLRPPGIHDQGKAPDENGLKALGDAMGKATTYQSQYSFQLYDTSGTTEDWNYAAAGTYGYTIEIGPSGGEFHGPYQKAVVDEWTGTRAHRNEGKGLREALLLAAEAGADASKHAVLTGHATPGRTLRLHKDFVTTTGSLCTYAQGYVNSNGDGPADCVAPGTLPNSVQELPDQLDYTTVVPASGDFSWHVTQSTRPFVGWKYDDALKGPVSTGKREEYTLTCEDGAGKVLSTSKVTVDRGQTLAVDPGC